MFIKIPFTAIKDLGEKETIIDETVVKLQELLYKDGEWYADYVRIRMKAIKNNLADDLYCKNDYYL